MNLDKNNVLKEIIKKVNDEWTEEDVQNRDDFFKKYGTIFQLENIDSLTPEKYRAFWKDCIFHWGQGYSQSTGNLIKEIPWETTKKNLKIIVDESKSLSERIKNLRNSENGGKYIRNSTYTAILHMVNPQKHPTINDLTIDATEELDLFSNKNNQKEWEWIPILENIIIKLCDEINTDTWKIDWVWARFMEQQSTQWWIISAGEKLDREEIWNEFKDSNTVGFYWNETGDLSKLTEEQIKEKFKQIGIKERGEKYDWGSARDILKIKKNDILFIKNGKRGFYGIGKATDTYQYNTNQSYHHSIPVQWITTQPYDTPDKIHLALQLNNTLARIPDKNQEPEIVKYYENAINGNHDDAEYFLLRHNVDGTWKDDLGKKYHFGKTVPNHIPLRNAGAGTKTIWFTKQSGEFYFWGYGTVKQIETLQENIEWNLVYDNFKYFVRNYDTSIAVRGKFLKQGNSSIKQQIENVPKYNKQTTMFKITKEIYDQILSQDLSHNNGGSTY